MPASPKLSIVMPVYNERSTIEEILVRVQAVELGKEIIVIDDGSTDGSRQFLKELAAHAGNNTGPMTLPASDRTLRADNIRVFFQDENRGKGAAVRRGFEEARGEIVIIQDADLETDPADYGALIAPIEQGRADVVFGSRFLGPHPALSFLQSLGNKVLTSLSNLLNNANLSDVWTCYKVMRRGVLQKLELKEDRFGFEAEITAKLAKSGCRILEVPVSYQVRTYAQGKKIIWKDGLRGIWCTLRYNLFS